MNSDFEKVYELSVNSHNDGIEGSYEYILMDSANYLYAWYENYLDLSDLPDGDYTAELCLADSDYSFTPYGCDASNWEAFQQNEPDWEPITGSLHFSVKNGIADHPKVVYQMQNAPSYASP